MAFMKSSPLGSDRTHQNFVSVRSRPSEKAGRSNRLLLISPFARSHSIPGYVKTTLIAAVGLARVPRKLLGFKRQDIGFCNSNRNSQP